MRPVEASEGMLERIKGMASIRDCTQELIRLQLEDYPEEQIRSAQKKLNDLYDAFVKDYGRIYSKTNKRAFHQDSSYCAALFLRKAGRGRQLYRKSRTCLRNARSRKQKW